MSTLDKKSFLKSFATAAALTTALSGCMSMGGLASPYGNSSGGSYDTSFVSGNGPACRAFQQAQHRATYNNRDSSRGIGQIVGGVVDGMLGNGGRSSDYKISRGIETTTRGAVQGMINQGQLDDLRQACIAETRNGYCETRTYDSSAARTVNGRVVGNYQGAVRQNRNCTRSGTAINQMPPLNGVVRP